MSYRVFALLGGAWRFLRAVSGDDAYDRYRQAGASRREVELSAAEFYRQRLERKYSRPSRCC